MLINCSNHPYAVWNAAQREAAEVYGEVVDLPFPQIEPNWTANELRKLTEDYCERIKAQAPAAVMVAGEFSFVFMLVDKLLRDGIKVIISCSRRVSVEVQKEDGSCEKRSIFQFECFREYARY